MDQTYRENFKSTKYYFKKYTNKKYAVFCSLNRIIHISNLLAICSLIVLPFQSQAQADTSGTAKIIDLEEVEIIAETNQIISEGFSAFSTVTILGISEQSPAMHITDVLRFAGNIDVRERGKFGIQSDISIRGGSFDHSMVLLNGINLSDPQTGHFSLNLPVDKNAIKRIEILNGTGTRIHGTNAFSGAINFMALPEDSNSFIISGAAGQYGYFSSSATMHIGSKSFRNLININNASSTGFTRNTDFHRQGFFYSGRIESGKKMYYINFGYSGMAFGANGFYSPRYPDQFEQNKMYIASLGFKSDEKIAFNPQIYWRRHYDRFELFREGKNWYSIADSLTISNNTANTTYDTIPWYTRHNHHINDIYGFQMEISGKTSFGKTTLGGHLRSENIISNTIGYDRGIVNPVKGYEHASYHLSDNRTNFDLYLNQTLVIDPVYVSAGILFNWNSYLPNALALLPGIDVKLRLARGFYLFGNYNYSQGLPTFTDLTYEDANNQGNNELKPYYQHVFNTGFDFSRREIKIKFTGFYQKGSDVIDWVWFEPGRFSPVNIDKSSCRGVEFSGMFDLEKIPFLGLLTDRIDLFYTYIDSEKLIPGNVSKYFNIKHKGSAMVQKTFFRHLTLSGNINVTDREGIYLLYDFENSRYIEADFKPYLLVDAKISYLFRNVALFIEISNLFNEDYIDTGSLIQPGRWITGGFKYKIENL